MRVAVVGAGWAGLSAAVHATQAGHRVTLYEMAHAGGGRARAVSHDGITLDNGQHILIGAYRDTLALMRSVGVDPEAALLRCPLTLVDAAGRGLRLGAGAPAPAFVRAVLALSDWSWHDRLALLAAVLRWRWRGFEADAQLSVADLIAALPAAPRVRLLEPLCVAALNTPPAQASARVFLRVLRDALFGGAGASDLLLPRRSLSALLAEPALHWLGEQGATLRLGTRAMNLEATDRGGYLCDGEHFDAVVLACSAKEAARLAAKIAPAWSAQAEGFDYEPIVSVVLRAPDARWRDPMLALRPGADAPAQFAFDLGALDPTRAGLYAFVVSGARAWVEQGLEATEAAVLRQAHAVFAGVAWRTCRTLAERRATFLCTPGLLRPAAMVARGLVAAGDYVDGPYPATLEGAVRSGASAASLTADV